MAMQRIASVALTCTIAAIALGAYAQQGSMSSPAGSPETTKCPEVSASYPTTFDSVTPPSPAAKTHSTPPPANAGATSTGTTFDSVTPPSPPARAYSTAPAVNTAATSTGTTFDSVTPS